MRLAQVFIVCAVLVTAALGLFAYKALVLHYPVRPNEEARSWRIEAKIRFYPLAKTPIQVHLVKPQPTAHLAIVQDNIIAPDYGMIEKTGKLTGNKRITLSRRQAHGQQILFYQAVLYELTSSNFVSKEKHSPTPLPLAMVGTDTPLAGAMQALISEARDKSAEPVSFALELARLLKRGGDERVNILQSDLPNAATPVAQVSALVNQAGIPARIVNGVALQEGQRGVPFIQWLEIFADRQWRAVDIENGRIGIPDNYLPWWRGTGHMVTVDGGQQITAEIALKYNRESAITQAQWQSRQSASWIAALSLFDLPIATQLMFAIVLMIPIGGLVIVLLRQVIGLPTFGTFMPVLVALSFRETGLLWGIALFGIIVFVGLQLRAYFEKLRLLVVPRLASVLTVVVLLIAALTVITFKLGINAGLSITLFPMIILTMMIERMALMTEEFGAKETRKTIYGTMIAASFAYFAMANGLVRHLVFVFPELLLIVLAATILLGRYNGYKLSEYFRFKKLAKAIAAHEGK